MQFAHMALLMVLCSGLAGCTLPRGAALQSEVTKARSDSAVALADFSVIDVSRATLPQIRSWPSTGAATPAWLTRQAQPKNLIIAPGDQIAVTVWDADEHSLLMSAGQKSVVMQEMTIAASGDVFLPFVGRIRLAGITPDRAREKIEQAYAASIPSAQVQLQLIPGRANTANMVAGVKTPGAYPLPDRDVTVLALLAMGGGVEPDMINPQVRLFRGNASYAIALERLYDDPRLDSTLMGGDRLIVEQEERAFLSLGSARNQARHIFPKENLSAAEAMAIMGGVNENRADPKGILVLRHYPKNALRIDPAQGPSHEQMIFVLDLTSADGLFAATKFRIMPDDLVYATESPITTARTILSLIGSVFGLGVQASDIN